jgi:hypothetical protein
VFLLFFVILFGFCSFCSPPLATYSQTTGKHSVLAVFCDLFPFLFILFPAFRYLFTYPRKNILFFLFFVILFGFCLICSPPFAIYSHTPEKHSVLIICFSSVGQFYALEYTCGQAEAVVSADVPRNTAASSADYGKIIQELESHRQELLRLHLDYSLSQGVRILSLALSHVLSFPSGGPLLSFLFLHFSCSETFT